MRALSLFSGIGGIDIALENYVRTIGYVEIDKYAQAVLLSRMVDSTINAAPIFRDITRLDGTKLRGHVDAIIGGFPCQDISVAGNGAGLDGKRSGLFFEIVRLIKQIQPVFIFLENVPAIRTRGLDVVLKELTALGYDCRWTTLSAASVGAPHKRERWFLLAHSNSSKLRFKSNELTKCESQTVTGNNGEKEFMANTNSTRWEWENSSQPKEWNNNIISTWSSQKISHPKSDRVQGLWTSGKQESDSHGKKRLSVRESKIPGSSTWDVEPSVGRVVNGLSNRSHRIKCLGNSVVPLQVKTAFERLIGYEQV